MLSFKCFNLNVSKNCNINKCYEALLKFKDESKVNFSEMDNFLWLTGKIYKDSLSGILSRDQYKMFQETRNGQQIMWEKLLSCNKNDKHLNQLKTFIEELKDLKIL